MGISLTVLLPAGPGALFVAGTVGFETDWGGAYRVAALTTGTRFGGALTGPLEVELRFAPLTRDRAAMSVAVGIEVRELPAAAGSGRG